jgi:hypothetical protein
MVREFEGKICKYKYDIVAKIGKYRARGHFSGLIISAPDHFETEPNL